MATKTKDHFIVILCGGTGPRLWPLSRANYPKQFLSIIEKKSLLIQTIERSKSVVKPQNIFLITNYKNAQDTKNITKNILPQDNIIIEPQKKNTAMAILYATAVIKNINPHATITSLPADHYIKNIKKFTKDIKTASEIASTTNAIVTIGIKPTNPDPSYGYIATQKTQKKYQKVIQFIEKPDTKTAQKYISQNYYWNAGIYTYSIPTIEQEFAKHQSKYFKLYSKLSNEINNSKSIKKIYSLSDNLAIDLAISQKSNNLILIPANFDWSDVGEWKTIFDKLKKNKEGNAVFKKETQFLEVNSKNCLVSGSSKKMIGLVGIENLAIIDTPDALLICNLDHSLDVRDLVTKIVANKKTENYFLKKYENK